MDHTPDWITPLYAGLLGLLLLVLSINVSRVGITRNAGASAPRAIGASLTWLMILLASGLAIFGALSAGRI